jgi:ubiquinone/menaquinone biosynthesis C-methylase UbiE/uncharacterized protein YbaR (Trm112 family)
MNRRILHILECPFCGGSFDLQPSPRPVVRDEEIVTGVLRCQCCAYPIVDGIPYLRTGPIANATMDDLGGSRPMDALRRLLEVEQDEEPAQFATFRDAVKKVSKDLEGDYLLYRFSDPTFLCSQALLGALVTRDDVVLDVGGGAGHLAWSVGKVAREVVVADVTFWKLWLARRFVATHCEAVCCDAKNPLPFKRQAFSLTYCSDALHYIWPRRLLAAEMMRATRAEGTILASHLHNALCENVSPGMPLTPAGYRHLFYERRPLLYKQSSLFDAMLENRPVDPGNQCSDADLAHESALILLAGQQRRPNAAERGPLQRPSNLKLNPLYVPVDGSAQYELRFPSEFYAEEFADCRRYLPDRVELPKDWDEHWRTGAPDARTAELISRHVLLDLPEGYL